MSDEKLLKCKKCGFENELKFITPDKLAAEINTHHASAYEDACENCGYYFGVRAIVLPKDYLK